MRRDEQGGFAGLIGATTGPTFVVALPFGTTLYGVVPALPIITGAVIMGLVTLFVWVHPRFRQVAALPSAS